MRLYTYDRRLVLAKREIELSHYGLEGLMDGRPVKLYHGATKLFRHFDINQSRDELVNKFYGRGIFLTPSKRVAVRYADANRNIGFDPSIIADLKRRNPKAGEFLQVIYDHGADGWRLALEKSGFLGSNGEFNLAEFQKEVGVDPNDLDSIAGYIIGSKIKPLGSEPDVLEELTGLFHGAPTGAPDWLYDQLDEVGLDSKAYRPKVYTVTVTVSNTLVTASKPQASKARSKGYECVVFFGSDLVEGVPEVAVFNPKNVRVKSVEVV